MPQNPLDTLLKGLREIKDKGGPTEPVRSLPRPTSTIGGRSNADIWSEKTLPLNNDEPLAQHGVLNALIGHGEPKSKLPSIEDIGSMSPATGVVNKLIPKQLPPIAPEAYQHVKAGGLRLYSRLTDAFAKAPKVMAPDKVRSIARQGASKEEIGLRKLEEFLTGRNPMDKVNQADVMKHLEANPLEFSVSHKGGKYDVEANEFPATVFDQRRQQFENEWDAANNQVNQLTHEYDTRYGHAWDDTNISEADAERYAIAIHQREAAQDAWDTWRHENNLDNVGQQIAHDNNHNYRDPRSTRTHWESMQTPGPSENYVETLINLPDRPKDVQIAQWEADALAGKKGTFDPGELEAAIEAMRTGSYDDLLTDQERAHQFQSPHWDEPNNLVHSRHNDRHLEVEYPGLDRIYDLEKVSPQTFTDDDGIVKPWGYKTDINPHGKQEWFFPRRDGSGGTSAFGNTYEEALENLGEWQTKYGPRSEVNPVGAGPKVRFDEEVQGDWPQAGKEHGWRTPEAQAEWAAMEAEQDRLNAAMRKISGGYKEDTPFGEIVNRISQTNMFNETGPYTGRNSQGYESVHDLLEDYRTNPEKFQGWLSPEEHQIIREYVDLGEKERVIHEYKRDNPIGKLAPPAAIPYKDIYHELQLKADVLDAANDPNLQGFYIADAHTNAAMEGHPYVTAGGQLYYDEKHPKTLKDMLNPYGVDIEHANLPSSNVTRSSKPIKNSKFEQFGLANYDPLYGPRTSKSPKGTYRMVDYTQNPGQGTHVMDVLPQKGANDQDTIDSARDLFDQMMKQRGSSESAKLNPSSSGWGGRWTPEQQKMIRERGFSAMAAFLALQQSLKSRKKEQ